MNNYLVQVSIAVPAESREKAEEKVREFFACVFIGGKPLMVDVQYVQEVLKAEPDAQESQLIAEVPPLGA